MVAVTFFGTEIFDSRICFFMKKKGDQEFKYTEFTLGYAVYYCQISRSQKMLQLPLVASLEMHAMALKIHDFGELRRCKRWRQRACSQSRT